MKTHPLKTLFGILCLTVIGLVAFPTVSEARDYYRSSSYGEFVGYDREGCPIYKKVVFCGYDSCGRPIYRSQYVRGSRSRSSSYRSYRNHRGYRHGSYDYRPSYGSSCRSPRSGVRWSVSW